MQKRYPKELLHDANNILIASPEKTEVVKILIPTPELV